MWLWWFPCTCEIQSSERPSIPINQVFKHTQAQSVLPLIFLDLIYTKLTLLRIITEIGLCNLNKSLCLMNMKKHDPPMLLKEVQRKQEAQVCCAQTDLRGDSKALVSPLPPHLVYTPHPGLAAVVRLCTQGHLCPGNIWIWGDNVLLARW